MPPTRCLTPTELQDLQTGDLSDANLDEVTEHLEVCPRCEAAARALDNLSDPRLMHFRDCAAKTPSAPAPLPKHVGGHEILEELGRGGMGVVYKARHLQLNRIVALKVLLGGAFAEPRARTRFRAEAEAIARLQHPNIVQVYEVGEHDDGSGVPRLYFTLEFVSGGNLARRLGGRPQPPAQAAAWIASLARAVHHAHAQGIVHRDLKPENVLLTPEGTLKVTDFGIAKRLEGSGAATATGLVMGTPTHMAPEQTSGQAGQVGPAADVYALGVILYEALTGRPPFLAPTVGETLIQVARDEPVGPRSLNRAVPRDLETICLKCLEKEPGHRYHGAGELADDLESWLEGRAIRARPVGRAERVWKWARRHPLPAALLVVLVLSLATGSAASTYFGVSAGKRADETQKALEKAEQATEAERWERYLSDISAASNALQMHNVGPARRALEAAPARYRNWEWRYLDSRLDGARSVLRGHQGKAWSVDFSPDGKRLASGSADQTVRLWDTATGKELAFPRESAGDLKGARFSPDGLRLVTGGDRVRLWDPATGDLLWTTEPGVSAGKAGSSCPTWSGDGRRLAGSQGADRVSVLDAATGREVFAKTCDAERTAVALSPDGRHVAANQADNAIGVWEMTTGREVVLRGPEVACTTIVYSPDGRRIAAGSIFPENKVWLWDAATGDLLGRGTGHLNEVTVLAFTPDGRRLASGSMDQTVRLWDGTTGEALAALRGHSDFVNDLAFSPDGAQLVSASTDQTLRLWDVAPGLPGPDLGRLIAVLRGHTGNVGAARFSHDGTLIASSSADGTVRLWDAELVARNGVQRGHKNYVYDVAFRPDGAEVASAAWDGTVRLWDPTTGRQTAAPLTHKPTSVSAPARKTTIVSALAYSPDGRRLATVVRNEGVWLWDLAGNKPPTRTCLWKDPADTWMAESHVAFQPGGTLLAWGSFAGPVRLWDLARGEEVAVLTGHEHCRDVAFRPDGKELAGAGEDGTVRLWDVATLGETAVLRGSPEPYRLAYSPDGRLLAVGARDKTVRLWDVATREEVGVLQLGGAVYGVAFSPDNTRLACACADNTIRLWDVARQREVAELRGHEAYVHAVAFSPDGTRLASASGDFTVRIWDTLTAHDRARLGHR